MRHADVHHHLRIDIQTADCEIPSDERTRMQAGFDSLAEAVRDFPSADLTLKVIRHAGSATYHVEFKLKVPGQTLLAGERDAYLDTAFQRGLQALLRQVDAYRKAPDEDAFLAARQKVSRDRHMIATEDPGDGPLADAIRAGDYRAFRTALAGYEDWLRKRIGRWVQRYPEADSRIGRQLLLDDLVEEVYLTAFVRFLERSTAVRFTEWLDSLIDSSLKELWRHPEEREATRLARTLREAPL